MNIYIAAPYEHRPTAVLIANALSGMGYSLCARWLTPEHDDDGKNSPLGDVPSEHALDDLEDVLDCDVLIAINPENFARSGTGGRHVEFGIAVARSKRIILIGDRTNVFHFLPSVMHIATSDPVDTLATMLELIQKEQALV